MRAHERPDELEHPSATRVAELQPGPTDVQRLATVLERLVSAATPPLQGAQSVASQRTLWNELTPAQRAILRFVSRYENTSLTYLSISQALELPALPGSGGRNSSTSRPISDKTVRKHCERLFIDGLLVRLGERGPIQLGDKGCDLLAAVPRDVAQSSRFA